MEPERLPWEDNRGPIRQKLLERGIMFQDAYNLDNNNVIVHIEVSQQAIEENLPDFALRNDYPVKNPGLPMLLSAFLKAALDSLRGRIERKQIRIPYDGSKHHLVCTFQPRANRAGRVLEELHKQMRLDFVGLDFDVQATQFFPYRTTFLQMDYRRPIVGNYDIFLD
ncbi:uncharacterized protein BO80DRAFT_441078 [Aspergillus ibericus CBS 121593]|uniref:Uncharacterized protein n=1 Tax=Aspergillus ibericus CBS 121593 TaxID=1448316 RepID=A0A395HC42_9EURO|nr:hypothetical protein BO80DRAFT_441078 [Aspergillus ibericus CBS 121593]RAL05497.1 hypothetical protein BO80DRAFT_441078 [Aspergillus ibericus CBS 121593]